MIKPDSYINIGKIIDYLIGQTSGLKINKAQMLKLNADTALKLFTNGSQRPYFHEI